MTPRRLLICATEMEARLLAEALRPLDPPALEGGPEAPFKVWRAPEVSAVCVVTGIGPQEARENLRLALIRIGGTFHSAVGFGFCGGLLKTAMPGTLAIPTRVLMNGKEEVPTEWLRMALASHAGKPPLRTLFTAMELVPSATEKAALFAAKGVEAVDMESGAWGEFCRVEGIPWAIVRSVLDAAAETLPESFRHLTDRFGNPIWPKIIGRFLMHPVEARSALKMQRLIWKSAGPPLTSLLVRWLLSERGREPQR